MILVLFWRKPSDCFYYNLKKCMKKIIEKYRAKLKQAKKELLSTDSESSHMIAALASEIKCYMSFLRDIEEPKKCGNCNKYEHCKNLIPTDAPGCTIHAHKEYDIQSKLLSDLKERGLTATEVHKGLKPNPYPIGSSNIHKLATKGKISPNQDIIMRQFFLIQELNGK